MQTRADASVAGVNPVERLSAVLDRLLPAVDELGGAGELGLGEVVRGDPLLDAAPGAIDLVLAGLPDGFEDLEPTARDEALRKVELAEPKSFGILVSVAYNAYYVDPRVLGRIGSSHGLQSRFAAADGYEVEPFDESILAKTKERKPFWREVES